MGVASTFLVVGLNPTIQNTFVFDSFTLGHVNRVRHHLLDLAGKGGNTSRVLVQLGHTATHLSWSGGRNGPLFTDLNAGEGIRLAAAPADANVRFCHTVIDENAGQATEIVQEGGPVGSACEDAVMEIYASELGSAHAVIISGSKARGFSQGVYPEIVKCAVEAGVRTILDIRGPDLLESISLRPDILKINLAEFAATFMPEYPIEEHIGPDDVPPDLEPAMMRLYEETGTSIILTHGKNPVRVLHQGELQMVTPKTITPVNPIGSGDSFTAGLAAGLHDGKTFAGAVDLALDCARRNALLARPGVIR